MKNTKIKGVRKNILLLLILTILYLICVRLISFSIQTLIPNYQFIGNATYAFICGATLYAFDSSSKKFNFLMISLLFASNIWVMKNTYLADNNFQYIYIAMLGYFLFKQIGK